MGLIDVVAWIESTDTASEGSSIGAACSCNRVENVIAPVKIDQGFRKITSVNNNDN